MEANINTNNKREKKHPRKSVINQRKSEAFCALEKKIKSYNPSADMLLINKAFKYAQKAHCGEERLSGNPIIQHCVEVAELLADIKMDSVTIAAGLLHDTIEHEKATKKELEENLGVQVAQLVDGVSVIKKVRTKTGGWTQTENFRKLLLATVKDVRVMLIRLAEKVHSVKTIESLPEDLREETAQKAMDIYAPIAERLGVYYFKWQLEDWAFKYLNHAAHTEIQNFLEETREERNEYIQKISKKIEKDLKKRGINADVYGRPKHFYSIYRKLQKEKKAGETNRDYLERLHDVQAFRILVKTVDECYQTLDFLHKKWEPWEKFKDYIANPKPNGYKSLHTSVWCEDDKIAEFQIRTHKMHEYNEHGPASHAFYAMNKETGRGQGTLKKAPEEYTAWLKNLVKWKEKTRSDKEFEEALKIDVYTDRVFVLTPKGDVLDLPEGATPIDFAYRIHSDLGNSCCGAKADGKLISLDCELQNGQVIKIITNKTRKGPSPDWLNYAKTNEAKNKIKKALRE